MMGRVWFVQMAKTMSRRGPTLRLFLTGTIAVPNVDGRIDHFAEDPGGRVFHLCYRQRYR